AAVLPHSAAVLPAFLEGARDLAEPVALAAGDQSWTVAASADGVTVTEGAAAATTLRADPGELVLLIWGRISLAEALARGARVDGDTSTLESLLAHLNPL
ncbi:MAG TPA: hypothetical protein VF112_06040, partial [Candidatus Dormibacteraeota bacterium]